MRAFADELAIAEFCETGSGSTPLRSNGDYFGGNVPWVKSGELRDSVVTTTEETVTDAGIRAARLRVVPKGTLLVAMYGATAGRTALLGVDATTNQAICHIRPDPKRADTRYLWFALQAKLPELLARRVGGAQPNISQETIRSTRVRLPPLPEQCRLAAVLDKADAVRRKRKQARALLDELLRSAFLDLFGDPIVNPKCWPLSAFDDVVRDGTAGNRKVPQDDYQISGKFPVIDQGAAFIGGWTDDEELLAQVDLPVVLFGDHTKTLKWVTAPFALGADGVKILIPRAALTPEYLYIACQLFPFPDVGYSRHFKFLKLWNIPIPDENLQKQYARIFRRIHSSLPRQETAIREAERLFNSLVAQAFSSS